jgi:hypothetical protein
MSTVRASISSASGIGTMALRVAGTARPETGERPLQELALIADHQRKGAHAAHQIILEHLAG